MHSEMKCDRSFELQKKRKKKKETDKKIGYFREQRTMDIEGKTNT